MKNLWRSYYFAETGMELLLLLSFLLVVTAAVAEVVVALEL